MVICVLSISVTQILIICVGPIMFCHCQKRYDEPEDTAIPVDSSFSMPQDNGIVQNDKISEASGLIASRNHPGGLWTHNDSGGKGKIYLIDQFGKHPGTSKT